MGLDPKISVGTKYRSDIDIGVSDLLENICHNAFFMCIGDSDQRFATLRTKSRTSRSSFSFIPSRYLANNPRFKFE